MALKSFRMILYVEKFPINRMTGLEIVSDGPKFYKDTHTHTHTHKHTNTQTQTHTHTHTRRGTF